MCSHEGFIVESVGILYQFAHQTSTDCDHLLGMGTMNAEIRAEVLGNMWGIVKIVVPFWVPIIMRGLIRGLI